MGNENFKTQKIDKLLYFLLGIGISFTFSFYFFSTAKLEPVEIKKTSNLIDTISIDTIETDGVKVINYRIEKYE